MKIQNSFQARQNCPVCDIRSSGFFCDLASSALSAFSAVTIPNTYPKGSLLFLEGQASNGVYVLCKGQVKLSICSPAGKSIILRIAEPGEVLGLNAAVNDTLLDSTAEVLENCHVNFVRKSDFVRLLEQYGSACFNAVKQMSREYNAAHRQIRSLGLSHSVGDRLIKLLLGWCGQNGNGEAIRLRANFTHEEIAEMIGTSRETVTRILKDLRDRELVSQKGAHMVIHDRDRLRRAIGTRLR
ncbi:MAG TPA: Crp/Fnr family transcriptional regulator [Blastocatellia bacterium]|nr:Crp/Fnr family transcriptional regulator [Blastocatellia bacterium]